MEGRTRSATIIEDDFYLFSKTSAVGRFRDRLRVLDDVGTTPACRHWIRSLLKHKVDSVLRFSTQLRSPACCHKPDSRRREERRFR